jgi:stage V sporulation protein D (sporulation-specific penicillin-binding protein)
MTAFVAAAVCIVIILTSRLVWLQIISGERLKVMAAEQWYRDLPLQAKRGDIYDINGNVLAQSTLTYSVYLRPVAVKSQEYTAQGLASILDLNYEAVLKKVTSKTVSEWLIKMQVDKETAMRLITKDLDGVYLSQTYRRTYPQGAVAGQVLGLVSIDGRGQEGVEAYYDDILTGVNGKIASSSDLRGVRIADGTEYYVPPAAGQDVTLNIDSVIQGFVQNALSKALTTHQAKSASALIMDVETGGIVAAATAPFYDMNEQPRNDAAALMAQIKNQSIINVLEPGSTFKIITLAAAIEEGVVDDDDRFSCSGSRTVAGERIRCWRSIGHGQQTLAEGVQNSCNCVFMELALRVGVDKYYEYLQKFGLGQKSGVDFFGEPSGLLLPKKYVREVDLARIGFGQAIAVSPIQFMSAVTAIIGDGYLKTPQFVNDASLEVKRSIVSQATSDKVRELLYGVVTKGSGKKANVSGYQIGGKTGTAQKYKDGIIDQGHYISSFLGFLSVDDNPKYACYLYVDEPSTGVYYGSLVAAPYVGEIFAEIAKYKKLRHNEAYAVQQEEILYEIPDVSGNDIVTAVAKLGALSFFIEIDGEGNTATGTYPIAGTKVRPNEPVVIFTK